MGKFENEKIIKIIGYIATGVGMLATLVAGWVEGKKMDKKIEEKVSEEVAKHILRN